MCTICVRTWACVDAVFTHTLGIEISREEFLGNVNHITSLEFASVLGNIVIGINCRVIFIHGRERV